MGLEPLVDDREAARVLGVKQATLQRWRWAGRGPRFIKIGRAVRYALEDLAAFRDAGARTSTSDPGPSAA